MTYSDYRRVARERLQGNWPLAIGVAAVACILGGLITGASFIPQFNFRIEGQDISNIGDLLNLLSAKSISAFGMGSALGLAQFLIGGVIELGLFVVGLFSELTRFGRLHSFVFTGIYSCLVLIPLYTLICKIGLIGGNTWKE